MSSQRQRSQHCCEPLLQQLWRLQLEQVHVWLVGGGGRVLDDGGVAGDRGEEAGGDAVGGVQVVLDDEDFI